MKLPILLTAFIIIATTLHAQTPHTDTYRYQKGGDSVRFVILAATSDTIQTTEYYRSGKVKCVSWRRDSIYRYDVLGQLIDKRFSFDINGFSTTNSCSYYTNGQVAQINTNKNGVIVEKDFFQNGLLRTTRTVSKTASGEYLREEDRFGVPIRAILSDTVSNQNDAIKVNVSDTVYFASGKVFSTQIMQNGQSFGRRFYNEKGILIKTTPPDSLDLIIFKDNVDCYYGLKNNRNDTIVKPRFDRIKLFDKYFFAAYVGESVILLDLKGAPMLSPVAHLSSINEINIRNNYYNWPFNVFNKDSFGRPLNLDTPTSYFSIRDGDKHGVMTANLSIVMPPQYLDLTRESLGDGNFWGYVERRSDSILSQGFLTRQGKPIFETAYKYVTYTGVKDYFKVNLVNRTNNFAGYGENMVIKGIEKSEELFYYKDFNSSGLGKADGTIVLPPKFTIIEPFSEAALFVVSLIKTDKDKRSSVLYDGVYSAQTNRWLIDSLGFRVRNYTDKNLHYLVVEQLATKKWGIMDTTGKYVLPLKSNSIGQVDDKLGLFWVETKGKYQIFDMINGKPNLHTTQYDFLRPLKFSFNRLTGTEEIIHFLAKRKGKWGVIDADEKVIKPFDYDYASVQDKRNSDFKLIKNNHMACFDLESLPNEMPLIGNDNNKLIDYPLADNSRRVFLVNDTGKVVIPPQYELIASKPNPYFAFVLDNKGNQKMIFYETEKVVDYPFNYNPILAHPSSSVIGVKDSTELSYGMVSTDGKVLMPCNNYGVAIGDVETSTFFVKRDTPMINRYGKIEKILQDVCLDTLNAEDNGWLMYDRKGKLMDVHPFRFPIDFIDGVGVGMQQNGFNLYKADGSILTPFVKDATANKKLPTATNTEGAAQGFNAVRRITEVGFYALYRNQGLTPTMLLTKQNGEIIVQSGRYDGISRFYGQYALVSANKKVGLINAKGQELIAPQDLRTYTGHFMDSLEKEDRNAERLRSNDGALFQYRNYNLPLNFENDNLHPDSLKITSVQRAALWNLMLEKCPNQTIATASEGQIPRTFFQGNADFLTKSRNYNEVKQRYPLQIIVEDKTIAFSLGESFFSRNDDLNYYNFHQRDGRWEELNLNDLLQMQGEKRVLLNDLLTKKIKALEDVELDCSNVTSYISVVENKWLLTNKCVDFCFVSTNRNNQFEIISFTWAELSPFLKLKIY
jgi:antitoxin component YwqK of YwqJK toxin-antitoxin module